MPPKKLSESQRGYLKNAPTLLAKAGGSLGVDPEALARLSDKDREAVLQELKALEFAFRRNPLLGYRPHPKQEQFHSAVGQDLRAYFGGNRAGKTTSTMVDTIIQAVDRSVIPEHLSKFKWFDPPFYARVVTPDLSNTMEGVVLQKFREWTPREQFRGGSFDRAWDKTLRVLHFKNGSWVQFFSNDQDLDKFGGAALHRVVYDEEPRSEVRRECRMRLIDYGGDELFGMTPLLGMCVDTATQALTKRGWKYYDELSMGEPILTYNIEQGATEWAPMIGMFRDRDYHGPMLRTPGHLDSVFTPDHKWVTPKGLATVGEMTSKDRAIVAANHSNVNVDLFKWDLLYLIGWVLSDGSVVKNENKVVIYQSATRYPEYCERIAGMLDRLGAQWHSADRPYERGGTMTGVVRRFVVTGDVARQIRWLIGYPKRLRPELVSSLSEFGLQVLLDGLLDGDGHTRVTGRWEFTSCDRELADSVCMIGTLLGKRTNLRHFQSKGSTVWRVTATNRTEITDFKRRTVEAEPPLNGIWCPTTPNRTWVARRNGTVFITGNSWVYEEVFEPWQRGDLPSEAVTIVDMEENPHLSKTEIERALSGMSSEERQARKGGRFIAFEGLVYPEWDEGKHVIPTTETLPEGVECFAGIDPGIRHMAAVVFAFIDFDNTMVVYDEVAVKGRTIREVCDEIHLVNARWGVTPRWYVIDPASRNKNHQTGRSDQQEFIDHGVVALPGQNSVTAGLNRVKERLEHDPPKLQVMAHCRELRREMTRYRWSRPKRIEGDPKEAPVKADDHVLDALRYVAMARPLPPKPMAPKQTLTQQDRLLRAALDKFKTGRPIDHPSGAGLFS